MSVMLSSTVRKVESPSLLLRAMEYVMSPARGGRVQPIAMVEIVTLVTSRSIIQGTACGKGRG